MPPIYCVSSHHRWQRCGVTTTSWSQNSSPQSGDMWIPHQRKSSRRLPQRVKWCALSFGIGKGWSFWISLNPDKLSTPTATSQRWLSWRLEFPESGQRRRQHFSCNTMTSGPIPVWWPWNTLSILAGLSYHTHHTVRIWCLLSSICPGRWQMDWWATSRSNDAIVRAVKRPPPLVRIFMSAACMLLFIAGESAQPMVVTMSKNSVLWLRICSIKQCYCALCIYCSFHGNK